MEITFAGHEALFFSDEEMVVAIDPWLVGNPQCPEHLKNPARLDKIVLTHGHNDHAGDVMRLYRKYRPKIIACYELCDVLKGEGVDPGDLHYMAQGGTRVLENGWRITLTPAIHCSSYDTAKHGPVYAGAALTIILRTGTHSIFHGGDTALFSDLKLIGELYQPDIAFLPTGDNYTMNAEEAVMAARWLGVRAAVPFHYATFPELAQDADAFIQGCHREGIRVTELPPGTVTSPEALLGG
ncbi:MAG: metal-dependent hydrolase [Armatimonadetes bacterium]|nr:metal-dependent hydrolase [Armatimonadota bacterium]